MQRRQRLKILADIFRSPVYIAIAAVGSVAYYFLFYFFTKLNAGLFLVTVPMYLIYLLIATGAATLAVGVYGIVAYKRSSNVAACSVTTLTPIVGGLVVSCGCGSAVLTPFLLTLGFNALQAVAISTTLARYNVLLVISLILINLLLLYYQLGSLRRFDAGKEGRG